MDKKILFILVLIIMVVAYFDLIDCFRKIEATTSRFIKLESEEKPVYGTNLFKTQK